MVAPHVAPTWIDFENDSYRKKTAQGRIKHKNVDVLTSIYFHG